MKKVFILLFLFSMILSLTSSCVDDTSLDSEGSTNDDSSETAVFVQIELPFDKLCLSVGQIKLITPVVKGAPEGARVVYGSSNNNIASVKEDGTITALNPGDTNITVSAGGVSATVALTVVPGADSITLSNDIITLPVGGISELTAVLSPEDLFDKDVFFRSVDENIATVNENGQINAIALGETQIEVYTANGKTATCVVKVVVLAEKIELDKTKLQLKVGSAETINATVIPSGSYEPITYKSDNTAVATVDGNGLVTARSAGNTTITVSAGAAYSTCNVSVSATISNLTEKPSVLNYVYTETDLFGIFGTCEDGSVIKVEYEGGVITANSDHQFFMVSVKDASEKIKLKITAEKSGKSKSQVLEYTVTKKPPNTAGGSFFWHMILGKDYQLHMNEGSYLNDYLHTNSFTDAQLENIKTKINMRVAQVKEINPKAEVIYMIIPSPATTYPETMPDHFVRENAKSRIEQLYEVVSESDAVIIDVISAFAQHKNDKYKLYWKTDSHWTDYGAFVAYTELFNYIKTNHPESAPRSIDDFDFVEGYYEMGDFAEYLGFRPKNELFNIIDIMEYNALRVPNFEMPPQIAKFKRYVSDSRLMYTPEIMPKRHFIDTEREDLPSAIIIRDSYSAMLFDIVAERFNKTLYQKMWDFTLYTKDIRELMPDYVIITVVERNIAAIIK